MVQKIPELLFQAVLGFIMVIFVINISAIIFFMYCSDS